MTFVPNKLYKELKIKLFIHVVQGVLGVPDDQRVWKSELKLTRQIKLGGKSYKSALF
jgi:hypothetical protein